jgi:hypothetical protein
MTINQATKADQLINELHEELTKDQREKLIKLIDIINK